MASALFTPGKLGSLTLPNRLIRSATQDPFGQRDGSCAPEQVALYQEIAQSGVGAIITAYSYISPEARSTGIQVGFATQEQRDSQKTVLDAVHAAGGRLILQLMHAGMNVFLPEKRVEGGKLLAPTGGMTAPNEMTTTELTQAGLGELCGGHLIGGGHAAGGGQELAALHPLFRQEHVHSRVHELEDQTAPGGVDGVQDGFLAVPLFLGGEAYLNASGTGFGGDVAIGGDDGPHAALGDFLIEGHLLGGTASVPLAEGVLGGGADEAVGQSEAAQLTGGEECRCHKIWSPFV